MVEYGDSVNCINCGKNNKIDSSVYNGITGGLMYFCHKYNGGCGGLFYLKDGKWEQQNGEEKCMTKSKDKFKGNKTIIVIPGAKEKELLYFRDKLTEQNKETLIYNKEIRLFKLVNGELFEVVSSLLKDKRHVAWFKNIPVIKEMDVQEHCLNKNKVRELLHSFELSGFTEECFDIIKKELNLEWN